MLGWITNTRWDIGLTAQRLILGIVFFAHGAQKVLGLFGGLGLASTVSLFESMGLPAVIAWSVPFIEFLGGIGLILGLYTRIWALGIAAIMVGAISLVHAPHGFFMNWFGNQTGEGFEYHLLVLAIAFSLMLNGGGPFSLDRKRATRNLSPNT